MGIGIEDAEQVCLACGKKCVNRRSLGNHVARSHRDIGDLQAYCLKYITQDVVPLCCCGCGQAVSWHKVFYRFNDYVSGHNKTGFRVTQPVFTREQIKNRNVKIRNTYAERGDEIKSKISDAVSLGLASQASKDRLSKSKKLLWSSESYREKQRIARIKSWQGPEGDARRVKVFTDSFGQKISASNMARDVKRTSRAETEFVERLRAGCGLDIETSKWFNFETKTWCADVWIPSLKTIVEFDGTYWHGLDRVEDFTVDQLVNMTNDMIKNKLAIDKRLSLIRIREDALPPGHTLLSLDDVLQNAYHIVKDGQVIKEGTLKMTDTQAIITRETLIIAKKEHGPEWIESTYMRVLIDLLRAHVSYWGWFYPEPKDDLSSVLIALGRSASTPTLTSSTAGSTWLKSRVKSFWDVDRGPSKTFHADAILRSVLLYRLGVNDSKPYTYELSNGMSVTCNETFDISLKDVRTGFVVQRNKVSWFKPHWAAWVYRRYLKDVNEPVVWDPSIGFSARILGFASQFSRGTYIGTDPAVSTHADAQTVAAEVVALRPGLMFDLRCEGSEKTRIEPDSLDLVFTSPPYFDVEMYFDEPGQCWRDYPEIELWRQMYLRKTLSTAASALKPGRRLVVNISSKYRDIVLDDAIVCGFTFEEEVFLPTFRDHFDRARSSAGRQESMLVFTLPR